MISTEFLHYGTIAFSAAINAIGVGIGEGLTTRAALEAMNIQPKAKSEITKAAILGMALIETSAIMGFSIALILFFGTHSTENIYSNIAEGGIALAICLPGFFIGL